MSNLFGAGLGNRENEPVKGREPIPGVPRNIPAVPGAPPPWGPWEMVQDRSNPTACPPRPKELLPGLVPLPGQGPFTW